jgi:D-aspartate ligase
MSAEERHTPVVVLGLGVSGLELCRALGRRGIRVIGLAPQPDLAAFSRYCQFQPCAEVRHQPEQLAAELTALAARLGERPVLMPTTDEGVAFLATHHAHLARCYRFVQPDPKVAVALLDKAESYRLALRHGLEAPRSISLAAGDDPEAARRQTGMVFPCVLKPANSADWAQPEARAALGRTKLLQVADSQSLRQAFARVRPLAARHVLQELIPGDDAENWYVLCHLARGGRSPAEFVHRKLLMRPPGRGVGCLIESVLLPELAARARSFLDAVGHVGLGGLEFKRDPRDGGMKLLDVNPRWGVGDSLAGQCGMDMAWLHYCTCLDQEEEAPRGYRAGVRWVQLPSVLIASWAARREGRGSILQTLMHLRGEVHHAVLAWDDLAPLTLSVRRMLRSRLARTRPASRAGRSR